MVGGTSKDMFSARKTHGFPVFFPSEGKHSPQECRAVVILETFVYSLFLTLQYFILVYKSHTCTPLQITIVQNHSTTGPQLVRYEQHCWIYISFKPFWSLIIIRKGNLAFTLCIILYCIVYARVWAVSYFLCHMFFSVDPFCIIQ